ncbi:MAG: DNA-binding YbaB/EbfC family protein [Myxococcota bacterium]|jgi:DNA-binding YbaB/EbfC family protein
MFDPNSMGPLFAGIQQAMAKMKAEAADLKCEGTAGGGMVKVVVTGDQQVVSVSIDPSAMDDRELLEDLIRAATGEALRQVRESMAGQMSQLAGGLPLPPGLLPF